MKPLLVSCQLLFAAGLLTLTGCSDNSADGLMKQQIAEMNKMADAMENDATAEATADAIKERMEAIGKQLEELKLTPEQQQALAEKYKPELEKAAKRIQAAMMKAMEKAMSEGAGQMGNMMEQMQQQMQNSFNQ